MDIKLFFLNGIIKWLVGGELFDFIRDTVEFVNNENLTGEQKREKVLAEARIVFKSASTFLVNLAIEVAVTMLKARAGELNGN